MKFMKSIFFQTNHSFKSILFQSHSFFKIFSVRVVLASSLQKKKVDFTCLVSEKEKNKRGFFSLFKKDRSCFFTNSTYQFVRRGKNFASLPTQFKFIRKPSQYEERTPMHFTLNGARLHFLMKKGERNDTHWQFQQKSEYKIIRPLLFFSRGDITCFCQSLKLPVYPDKSNQTLDYSRNKIRKQIFPSLQLFFNPQVENSIFQFAEWVTQEKFLVKYD